MIPDSPLLYYSAAFPGSVTPSQIESKFRSNRWTPQVPNLLIPFIPPKALIHPAVNSVDTLCTVNGIIIR